METSEGASSPSESRGCVDFSAIRNPVQLGSIGLKQLLQCYHVGSEEVRMALLRECDVIIECKVCRSLYRGLPNFLAHKRHYCTSNYSGTLVRFQDMISKEDEAAICGTVFGEEEFYREVAQANQNVEAVRNRDTVIRLDTLDQTKVAVSQTYGGLELNKYEDIETGSRKRKAEDDFQRPTKLLKMSPGSSALDGVFSKRVDKNLQSLRAFLIENRLIKPSTNVCVQCRIQFSGKGPLNKHMKRKHFKRKVFRQCLKCPQVFLSDSCYLTHCVGEHAMSVAVVKEKLASSVGLVEKIVHNNSQVYDVPKSFSFLKNQTIDHHQSGQEQNTDSSHLTSTPVKSTQMSMEASSDSELTDADNKELAVLGALALGIAQENWYQRFKCLVHPKFKFKKYVSFREHVVTQHCVFEIKCIKCPSKFTQKKSDKTGYFSNFVKHLESSHGITGNNLTTEMKTSLRENILEDVDLARDFEVIKCHLCTNTYGQRRTLKRHLLENHNLSVAEADNIVHSMKTAELSHLEENDEHDTSKEDQEQAEKSSLKYHILKILDIWTDTNNAFQKFKCFTHPSHLFRQYDTFKEHLLKHHCLPVLKCLQCKAVFGNEDDCCQNFDAFVEHLEDSHGFSVEEVSQTRDQLQKILMKNPKEIEYLKEKNHQCHLCQSFYNTRKYLMHHLRQVHGIYANSNESASHDHEEPAEAAATAAASSPSLGSRSGPSPSPGPILSPSISINEEQKDKDFFLFLALGIWGRSDSKYQVYKCYTHPSVLFKRFSAVRDHIYKHHCKKTVCCPQCQKNLPLNEIMDHLIDDHGTTKENVKEIQSSLQKAVLKDPLEATKYEGRSVIPLNQPIVYISKLENSKAGIPKSVSITTTESPKDFRTSVSSRRSSQSLISTFSLEDFHCPKCVRTFTQMYAVVNHLTDVHGIEKEKALEMREIVKKESEKWRNQNLMIRSGARIESTGDFDHDEEEEEEEDDEPEMIQLASPSRRKQLSPIKCQNVESSLPKRSQENAAKITEDTSGSEYGQSISHPIQKSSESFGIKEISFGAGFSLHKCDTCGKIFGKEAVLAAHKKTCTIEIPGDTDDSASSVISCSASARIVRKSRSSHIGPGPSHHPEQSVCNACNRTYKDLENHLRYYCKKTPNFKCPNCNKKFMKKSSLSVHVKYCSVTKETDSSEGEFESSESEKSADNKPRGGCVCPECGTKVQSQYVMRSHMKKIHRWSKSKISLYSAKSGFRDNKQPGNANSTAELENEEKKGAKEPNPKVQENKAAKRLEEKEITKGSDSSVDKKVREIARSNLQLDYLQCPLCPRTFVRFNSKVSDHWRLVHGLDKAGIDKMKVQIFEHHKQRLTENLTIHSDRASRRASEGMAAPSTSGAPTNGNSSDSSCSRKTELKKSTSGVSPSSSSSSASSSNPSSASKLKQRLSLPS